MTGISNVYCVGRNYGLHAAELGNAVPDSPMIFMKPSHALAAMDGGELLLPAVHGSVHYETELVVRMDRTYAPGISPYSLISHVAVGLDLTLRDVQTELKQKQHPWLKAKGFARSAPMGAWVPIRGNGVPGVKAEEEVKAKAEVEVEVEVEVGAGTEAEAEAVDSEVALTRTPFTLCINGEQRQRGILAESIFDLPTLIEHIGSHYGLGEGDIIFTGTPAGVGELHDGDKLELFWGKQLNGSCVVHLR